MQGRGAAVDERSHMECSHDVGECNHYCSHYSSSEEQWQTLRPHLTQHLAPKCVSLYLYDEDESEVIQWLKDDGYDPVSPQALGILRFISATSVYKKNGLFDQEVMLGFVLGLIEGVQKAGVERLFITSDMKWAEKENEFLEQLVSYESAATKLFKDYPWITILCQYDLRVFSGVDVFNTLKSHCKIQLEDRVVHGF